MNSMTGFGLARISNKQLELEVIVKSVNGRYLDSRLQMPREYSAYETNALKIVGEYLKRGSVTISVNRKLNLDSDAVDVQVQSTLAKKWMKACQKLAKDLKLTSAPDINILLKQGEVLRVRQSPTSTAQEEKIFYSLLHQALKKCSEARAKEGSALAKSLVELLKELEKNLQSMEKYKDRADSEIQKKYQDRLAKLGLPIELDDPRVLQEVAIIMERNDVHEEIVRLRTHIKNCQALMMQKTVEGKKLDFYSQELLREVNTIGSKAQVAELTRQVVDAKSCIERWREQVQNIE